MKVSTQTRYAMRMLLELALNEKPYERLTTQQIANSQGISEKYLEAIANKLKKAGYLDSSKGIGGGYLLRVKPEDITLGDVMRLMETTFFQTHCVKDADEYCQQYYNCVMVELFETLEEALRSVVDNITVAQIRDRYIEKNKGKEQGFIDKDILDIFEKEDMNIQDENGNLKIVSFGTHRQ